MAGTVLSIILALKKKAGSDAAGAGDVHGQMIRSLVVSFDASFDFGSPAQLASGRAGPNARKNQFPWRYVSHCWPRNVDRASEWRLRAVQILCTMEFLQR